MIPRALKRLSGVFLLMILVCIPQSAGAINTVTESGDSINSTIRLDNPKIGQILESLKGFFNNIADNYPEGVNPVDLNFKLDLNLDLRSSQPFLLIQVIYNTLAGDDGMLNQLKDKKIEKFDEKTLNKLKRQFTRRSNKEIKKVCEGDRQTQKELKRKIKELLDGIQIKE
ncbi:MAG: hypothetical protein J5705_06240 [Bacteroidaceae bacterium]|nr:hypothetical protein [Bacteroidaceae bacterium]